MSSYANRAFQQGHETTADGQKGKSDSTVHLSALAGDVEEAGSSPVANRTNGASEKQKHSGFTPITLSWRNVSVTFLNAKGEKTTVLQGEALSSS